MQWLWHSIFNVGSIGWSFSIFPHFIKKAFFVRDRAAFILYVFVAVPGDISLSLFSLYHFIGDMCINIFDIFDAWIYSRLASNRQWMAKNSHPLTYSLCVYFIAAFVLRFVLNTKSGFDVLLYVFFVVVVLFYFASASS